MKILIPTLFMLIAFVPGLQAQGLDVNASANQSDLVIGLASNYNSNLGFATSLTVSYMYRSTVPAKFVHEDGTHSVGFGLAFQLDPKILRGTYIRPEVGLFFNAYKEPGFQTTPSSLSASRSLNNTNTIAVFPSLIPAIEVGYEIKKSKTISLSPMIRFITDLPIGDSGRIAFLTYGIRIGTN